MLVNDAYLYVLTTHNHLFCIERAKGALMSRLGLTEEAAAAPLTALSQQLETAYPGENKNQLLSAQKLPRASISTSPQDDGDMGGTFAMLIGMAVIVLVVACLNLANMMLARGSARRKEIAMRLALGGNRLRIVRQLLTEGMMLSLVGGAFGLLLGYWSISLLMATLLPLSPVPIVFDGSPDARVVGATVRGFDPRARLTPRSRLSTPNPRPPRVPT